MFRMPRVNVIEAKDGYSVEILGRTGLLYRQGEKSIRIDAEGLATPAFLIYRSSMKTWLPPYETDVISDIEREELIEHIRAAVQFYGIELQVI